MFERLNVSMLGCLDVGAGAGTPEEDERVVEAHEALARATRDFMRHTMMEGVDRMSMGDVHDLLKVCIICCIILQGAVSEFACAIRCVRYQMVGVPDATVCRFPNFRFFRTVSIIPNSTP